MGLRINELLTEKGVSVAELGRRINTSRSSMHATLEKGNPQYTTLVEIAKALEVDITDLFDSANKDELTALIDHKGRLYSAKSLEELEKIVEKIREKE